MEDAAHDDRELMSHFREGNPRAFQRIHEKYHTILCLFVFRMVNDLESAKDVVAEVFVSLWKRHTRFETLLNVQGYLYITARNGALSYLRKIQDQQQKQNAYALAGEAEPSQWLPSTIQTELLEEILQHVEELPDRQRLILRMIYFDGLSIAEAAEQLSLQQSQVRLIKFRALGQLKAILRKKNLL